VALNFIVNFGVDSGECYLALARVVHVYVRKEKGREVVKLTVRTNSESGTQSRQILLRLRQSTIKYN